VKFSESLNTLRINKKKIRQNMAEKAFVISQDKNIIASLNLIDNYVEMDFFDKGILLLEKNKILKKANEYILASSINGLAIYDKTRKLIGYSHLNNNRATVKTACTDKNGQLFITNENKHDKSDIFFNHLKNRNFRMKGSATSEYSSFNGNKIVLEKITPINKTNYDNVKELVGYVQIIKILDEEFVTNISLNTSQIFSYHKSEESNQNTANAISINQQKITADSININDKEFSVVIKDKLADGTDVFYNFSTDTSVLAESKNIIIEGIIILTIIAFIFVTPISYLIFNRVVTKPVIKLEQTARKIENGNYENKIEVNSNDEIGYLAETFNNMMDKINIRTEQLLHINETLENKVQVETEKRMNSEKLLLEQKKFIDMGQVMNAVAHRWRQPLNTLGLNIQSIIIEMQNKETDKDFLKSAEKECLNIIKEISLTIDNFMNFFTFKEEEKDFRIIKALSDVLEIYNAKMKDLNIKSELNCSCGEMAECLRLKEAPSCKYSKIHVHGLKREVKQSLMNVYQNAIQAVSDNGEANCKITTSINILPEKVIIIIEDNAGGVKDDIIDNIFDPYFTTRKEGEGTGLGLYMTKAVIEQNMSGSVTGENTDNGFMIKMEIPLAENRYNIENVKLIFHNENQTKDL